VAGILALNVVFVVTVSVKKVLGTWKENILKIFNKPTTKYGSARKCVTGGLEGLLAYLKREILKF